ECEIDIVVVNPDGQEASAPDKFEYLDCVSSTPPPDDECSPPEDGWRATLTLASEDNSTTLIFGIDPEATDGFNPGLDSAAPPLAPGAEFNAAFAGEFFDLAVDIRGFDQLEDSWTVVLMSQDRATFEADVSEIPECFTVQLGMADLREQPSGMLNAGEHLLTVKPGRITPAVDGESTVAIHLERGWNLISFPGDLVDSSPQSVLGGSVMQILDSGSSVPETLKFGEGYWALAIAPTELEVILHPITQYTRSVKRGWNLIGSVILDAPMPEGVIQLAGWNAKTQEYESPTALLPTVGYWAFVLEDGEITVSTAPPPAPGAPGATSLETLWQFSLMLTDAKGRHTKLEMGIAPRATSGYDQNLDGFLPPPAPNSSNAPKAGFIIENEALLLQRSVISLKEADKAGWSLRISPRTSTATLHWDVSQIPKTFNNALRDLSLQLVDGNRRVDMSRASSYRIPPGVSEIQFVLRRKSPKVKPSKSLLLQNFPNPFNPETWIPYQLADSADVSLTIYDVHGRIVRKLALGHKVAGIYLDRGEAAYWDGRNDFGERVSSGLYFYRLKAGNFTAVRKMVIAK
ncbi:MAG: T9SS type A sorting domain-containing protein, partial [Candidatus Poribacteria bacterium]